MTDAAPAGSMRTGWGFDAHRLNLLPPLVLGGVVISEEVGVEATSDGDVVAHALTDAILGASVLGDMGEWFPSDDPAFQGADSMALLGRALEHAAKAGWAPGHVDITVISQDVRIAPHRSAIRAGIASRLGLGVDAVSVKATTTDGLGWLGAGEGIAAVAVMTVERAT